jgi:hypothetical protein
MGPVVMVFFTTPLDAPRWLLLSVMKKMRFVHKGAKLA